MRVRLRRFRRRLPIALLIVAWTAGWWLAWDRFLFDQLAIDSGPGAALFVNERHEQQTLWVATGTTLVMGFIGFLFLVWSSTFEAYSQAWSRTWLGIGGLLIVIGLAAPIAYPSAEGLVVDGTAEVVSLDTRWLYAEASEAVPFDEITRVGLRVRRTRVDGIAAGCQVATGLSIVRIDRTWLEAPKGIDHEAAAEATASMAGKPLETLGTHEC